MRILIVILLFLSACAPQKSSISSTLSQMSANDIEYGYVRIEDRKNKVDQ